MFGPFVFLTVRTIELLRQLLPRIHTVAMVINPQFAGAEAEMRRVLCQRSE
jgi:hypothetical protein